MFSMLRSHHLHLAPEQLHHSKEDPLPPIPKGDWGWGDMGASGGELSDTEKGVRPPTRGIMEREHPE
jgi:hypothetical protein